MKFPGTNRIMRVKKVAFVASKIEGMDVFRLPHREFYLRQRVLRGAFASNRSGEYALYRASR